jgi:hypothetical protein
MNVEHDDETKDILKFSNDCVLMRSIYVHGRMLFQDSTNDEIDRMHRAAPVFFGDLSQMFNRSIILEVCKITDPAKMHGNDNLTIAFLLQHYNLNSDRRLTELEARINVFRKKLLPARHKRIAHSDRTAAFSKEALGAAPREDWNQFWLDLQDLVDIIHKKVVGTPFLINGVAMLSDVDGLLKALKHGECFEELASDPALSHRCADLALS